MIRALRTWLHDTRGASAIAFALVIPIVIGAAGVAVDLSRAYMTKRYLSASLDAAALATAGSSGSNAQLQTRMQAYFDKNFSTTADVGLQNIEMTITQNLLTIEATARVDTSFMHVMGFDHIDVYATTTVKRELRGIEVALVLDNTGSMITNNNIGSVRTASRNFVNTMFSRATDPSLIKVAIVPYAAMVNPGPLAPSLVASPITPPATQTGYPTLTYNPNVATAWHGCVIERPYPNDTRDTSIAVGGRWTAFWWPHGVDNAWNSAQGGSLNTPASACNNRRTPNLGCPTPITPLTSNQTTLLNAVNAIDAWCRGGTTGNIGMAWGLRVLSPEAPFTEGAAYDNEQWKKAVVMMTDGDNLLYRGNNAFQSDWTGHRRLEHGMLGTTNANIARDRLNQRFEETCNIMRDLGITVYTVTFTSGINNATKDFYRRCATDTTKYYDAPTQQDLLAAFDTISRELSSLHIQQ